MDQIINYSIIIPHKNTPNLLQQCLDSIPYRDDIQIIVVDDNSEDKTNISDTSTFDKIQKQRHDQRKTIFRFSLWIVVLSLGFVAALIIIQLVVRLVYDAEFSVLDNHQMEIIIVGVVLQAFGIIAIITKSIWNDINYKDILKDEHVSSKNKKRREK